jgi:hypothetical protein
MPFNTVAKVFNFIEDVFKKEILEAFKFILEQKHLYQNFEINIKGRFEFVEKMVPGHSFRVAKDRFDKLLIFKWDDVKNRNETSPQDVIWYTLPTVKIYCATCKRIEAFNPVHSWDVLKTSTVDYHFLYKEQLFLLIYQCQSCKKLPEVFLIRRKDWKLNIAGRSPIEKITVDEYIPKDFSKYISDAKLAFNSGQTLAGLFFLRVFIEQYTKSIIKDDSLKADEVIERYSDGLPTDFKDKFPSLKSIYSKLSAAIHDANSNEELFKESLAGIQIHFDAKRLFKI